MDNTNILDYNNTPLQECEGFTPLQMHNLIYFPFEEDCPIKINRPTPEMLIKGSPILKIVLEILLKLKSGRIKLTQTGNLPPSIIKEIYSKGYFPERWIEDGFVKIRTETDWTIIHNVKLVMVLAGLTKKANNWLSLTKKGETLLKNDNITEIFLEFLKAFTTKFSWAYNDGFQDEKLGQIGFLYSLFLLNKYGDKEKEFKFYADKYFLAFPSFIEFSAEDETMLGPAYYTRFFERFALWFGFVEVKIKEEKTQEDILFPERVKMLKSTELLNSMLKVK